MLKAQKEELFNLYPCKVARSSLILAHYPFVHPLFFCKKHSSMETGIATSICLPTTRQLPTSQMNPGMDGYFGLQHSTYKEDNGVIDLGLSLKTQHPQVYHSSTQFGVPEGYNSTEWTNLNPEVMSSNVGQPLHHDQYGGSKAIEESDEEVEGVQSKERWGYVKVNMDGVVVGRKICILDHSHYSTLAIQLEDMFGRLCIPGLRLFQAESDFCLFYKDSNGIWRHVGDVPWKDFVDCVKRLKIVRKNRTHDLYWQ